MPESVEDFLARGGKISKIESGKSGLDMSATYQEKIKRSTNARHKAGRPITVVTRRDK
jgi:hypothetical protein